MAQLTITNQDKSHCNQRVRGEYRTAWPFKDKARVLPGNVAVYQKNNGITEGISQQDGDITHQAYAFRNFENYGLDWTPKMRHSQ